MAWGMLPNAVDTLLCSHREMAESSLSGKSVLQHHDPACSHVASCQQASSLLHENSRTAEHQRLPVSRPANMQRW